jgi:hypothetical protein
MHKNATKCNKTQSKWCINKHGASKIIDTFETYQGALPVSATTWNLHTTQPNYFAPTNSEVVNLTGFTENKGLDI